MLLHKWYIPIDCQKAFMQHSANNHPQAVNKHCERVDISHPRDVVDGFNHNYRNVGQNVHKQVFIILLLLVLSLLPTSNQPSTATKAFLSSARQQAVHRYRTR